MQLLHASDMDGAAGALSNVENFSAILDGLRKQFPDNTLVVSSGDNFISGPRYYAAADSANDSTLGISGEGRGDIALLNAMGFQASALGNHELDRGTEVFASLFSYQEDETGVYPGARFPYLSSNLDFSSDEAMAPLVVVDGQEAMLAAAGLAKSAVVTVNEERIGVVGATTPFLGNLTKAGAIGVFPEDQTAIAELAAIIQVSVDQLAAQGIDKIILLAHMQRIAIEQELATLLSGVDIIVAGGSNTLLADETDRLWTGDEPAGDYPLSYMSAIGEPVLLVNTDADYRYLGRLVVDFDSDGVVIPNSIDPYMSGVYATNPQGGHKFAGQPIPEVSRIVESLHRVVELRDGNVFGRTEVFLEGRRAAVRTQETNLGNLVADSFLWAARQVDPEVAVSFKNSGGIRDDIGIIVLPPGSNDPADFKYMPPRANSDVGKETGDISQLDIEGTLRFNNGVVIVPLTARLLMEIMEHSISFDGVGVINVGRYPQVAGMRLSFDPAAPAGDRIRSLAVVNDDGTVADRVVVEGELHGDPERVIKMATMDFLADGGSGFPFPLPAPGRVDLSGETGHDRAEYSAQEDANGNGVLDGPAITDPGSAAFAAPGTEQDVLAEYLATNYAESPYSIADTPPEGDRRLQNLGNPGVKDTVFDERQE